MSTSAVVHGAGPAGIDPAGNQPLQAGPARRVLMIRPACFGANAATATSNAFQRPSSLDDSTLHAAALAEFSSLAAALDRAGVQVFVADDTAIPEKPDAVFPNNWVSFHADGRVILYPMEAPNRRTERRLAVLEDLVRVGWITLDRVLDLSGLETSGHYLEGTGSLVLDRGRNRAYAGLSSRSHPLAIERFMHETGIAVQAFRTADAGGRPLYHTNVMLSLGERFAVICPDAVPDVRERAMLQNALTDTGRALIPISLAQVECFAGNILELGTGHGSRIIAMSERARNSLNARQLRCLSSFGDILPAPVAVIEAVGGGSVRCMIAEIFP